MRGAIAGLGCGAGSIPSVRFAVSDIPPTYDQPKVLFPARRPYFSACTKASFDFVLDRGAQ